MILAGNWIIGDIGGTSSRLALLSLDQNKFNHLRVYKNQEFSNLQEVLSCYLEEIKLRIRPSLFLALAGPVIKGEVRITNLNWQVKKSDLRRLFSFQRVILVNDLYAQAGAIFYLSKEDLFEVKKGKKLRAYPKALLSVGTGLGMAFLLGKNPLKILASEGGHTPFPVQNLEELKFLEFLSSQGIKATFEETLSGRALSNWYSFYSQGSEKLTPEEVSLRAREGDTLALKAVEKIFSLLGRKCYEIAITLQPFGGIYLGGGVLQNLREFLGSSSVKKSFLEEYYFSDKLKNLLEEIPIYLILHPFPGLLGALTILRSRLRK